jgi:hypothetical protein
MFNSVAIALEQATNGRAPPSSSRRSPVSSRLGRPGGEDLEPHFFFADVAWVNPTIVPLPESRFLLGGGMIENSGPAPARVSRFRARESGKVMPTSDTSGPLFSASSPSASLQWFLESKLRARMAVNGSPEYELIWKMWDMPAGPPICALQASGRSTRDSDFSGAPTCTALSPLESADPTDRIKQLPSGRWRKLSKLGTDGSLIGLNGCCTMGSCLPRGCPHGGWDTPAGWLNCAPSATPSSRKSRRK